MTESSRPRPIEPVRIGAVSYLNTRPLVHGFHQGLGADRVTVVYEVPSTLARMLAARELDVALVPCIELARIPGLTVVPGLGIASRGDVRSVHLVTTKPLDEIRCVALDPDSRTSNTLVRVLFEERWKTRPRFEEGGGSLDEVLASRDAAVRIGDKALLETVPSGAELIDLAGEWSRWTGLPFVFAVWAARPDALVPGLVDLLHESYRQGRDAVDSIVKEHARRSGIDPDILHRYLTHHIRFHVGEEELTGMRRFFREADNLGLIERVPEVTLAPVPAAEGAP